MASPSYQGAGAGATGTGSTLAVAYPASIAANDTLILQIKLVSLTKTPTTPAGWTYAYGPDDLGDTADERGRQFTYIKQANGSESGNLTVSFSATPTEGAAGRMYRFSGSTGSYEGGAYTHVNDTTVDPPDLVTTGTDRLGIVLVGIDRSCTIGNFTGETGGNYTEAVAEYSASGVTLQLQTATLASATTVSAASVTPSVAMAYAARVFALYIGVDSIVPDADITTTGWTTTPLFSKINDASDGTVITATAS